MLNEILETRADTRGGVNGHDPGPRDESTTRTVIIVDRETMHRGHLREIIEEKGCTALAFCDAYEMMRHLERDAGSVKAVFIDSGIFSAVEKTLISMVSNAGPRIRLILTDTEMSRDRIRRFIEKGVYGCVRKPYSEQEIVAFLH